MPQIDKDVCSATEFVCDARWLTCHCGHHANADALALHSLHKHAKVAVPGKQHDLVELSGKFHCIHGEFDTQLRLGSMNDAVDRVLSSYEKLPVIEGLGREEIKWANISQNFHLQVTATQKNLSFMA